MEVCVALLFPGNSLGLSLVEEGRGALGREGGRGALGREEGGRLTTGMGLGEEQGAARLIRGRGLEAGPGGLGPRLLGAAGLGGMDGAARVAVMPLAKGGLEGWDAMPIAGLEGWDAMPIAGLGAEGRLLRAGGPGGLGAGSDARVTRVLLAVDACEGPETNTHTHTQIVYA